MILLSVVERGDVEVGDNSSKKRRKALKIVKVAQVRKSRSSSKKVPLKKKKKKCFETNQTYSYLSSIFS